MAEGPAITAGVLAVMAVHLVTIAALPTMAFQPLVVFPGIAPRQAVPVPMWRKSND
jgi:hypothetical protein